MGEPGLYGKSQTNGLRVHDVVIAEQLRLEDRVLQPEQLAALMDVSSTSVAFWEQGRTRPSEANKKALVALRKLGKREAKEILAQKAPAKPKAKKVKKKKKRKKKTAKKKRR